MSVPNNLNRTSTEDRIVEAAVQLFARQGFKGSSTREIARLAGVNEVTLFRHFPRKRDLFWAAIESRFSRLRLSRELKIRLEADEDPQLVVPTIIELLVEKVCYQSELTRLLYLSLFELESGTERIFRKHLSPVLLPVRNYLARCASKGTIRSLDPDVATLGLLATVVVHHTLPDILGADGKSPASTEDAVAAYTDFWVEALTGNPLAETPNVSASSASA
jgi:AcrR family transcriptional regulator